MFASCHIAVTRCNAVSLSALYKVVTRMRIQSAVVALTESDKGLTLETSDYGRKHTI